MGLPTSHVRAIIAAAFIVTGMLLLVALGGASGSSTQAAASAPAPAGADGGAAQPTDFDGASPQTGTSSPDATSELATTVRRVDESATTTQPQPQPRECDEPATIVDVTRDLPIRSEPGGGTVIGTLPARSKYLGSAMHAWVRTTSGNWGLVTVPWAKPVTRTGWINLRGLNRHASDIRVTASLSRREIVVTRGCREVLRAPAAVGAASSPSPRGRFWVTDPTPVPAGQPQFGSYAFGLSTIQPNLPAGWTGGNQMAIHGTNAPSSIGTAASAGCLRVSEATLGRLRELLEPGTPVTIGR